jgi:hypothetical protein
MKKSFKLLPGILKSAFTLLILLATIIGTKAQSLPSANMTGPVKAFVTDSSITVINKIAAIEDPVITYTLENNSSGAEILSKGAIQYNQSSSLFTQTINIKPGAVTGSFTIKSEAVTRGGKAQSSMSITVIK